MTNWLLIPFVLAFLTVPALSQQSGKISTDGTAVYSQPDFDSEVIDYLSQGVELPMSKRQFEGKGGMGLFHKVKTPNGKFGFVPDTDVQPPKGSKPEAPQKPLPLPLPPPKPKETVRRPRSFEEDEPKNETMFFTRAMGGGIGFIDYTEKFSGEKLHKQMPFFGFRMTGPGILFDGPPLDFNILIYPSAPKYLGEFGKGNASGFLILGDLVLMLPFWETKHAMVNYGAGLMWTLSNYTVQVGSQNYDSKDLRIGVEFELGYAYKITPKYIIRADLKYFIERTMYLSELISFQVVY